MDQMCIFLFKQKIVCSGFWFLHGSFFNQLITGGLEASNNGSCCCDPPSKMGMDQQVCQTWYLYISLSSICSKHLHTRPWMDPWSVGSLQFCRKARSRVLALREKCRSAVTMRMRQPWRWPPGPWRPGLRGYGRNVPNSAVVCRVVMAMGLFGENGGNMMINQWIWG